MAGRVVESLSFDAALERDLQPPCRTNLKEFLSPELPTFKAPQYSLQQFLSLNRKAGKVSLQAKMAADETNTSIHWFRMNCLRLHDNPALFESMTMPSVKCVFILDPQCNAEANRGPSACVWKFLLESLKDLNDKLRKAPYNSRLFVFQGEPTIVLPKLIKHWKAKKLTFQASQNSCEAVKYDRILCNICMANGATVFYPYSNTLFTPAALGSAFENNMASSFKEFLQVVFTMQPSSPAVHPSPCHAASSSSILLPKEEAIVPGEISLPSIENLGFGGESGIEGDQASPWAGGETQALSRLTNYCYEYHDDKNTLNWLLSKESLSPYFRFGCLSVRLFYARMQQYTTNTNGNQNFFIRVKKNMLLREYSYFTAMKTASFDQQIDNPLCLPIRWDGHQADVLDAVYNCQTGIPWIDAIMVQIITEGWAHYLARKSFAYFLTRGCLWLSWELGRDIFRKYMLDHEDPISCMCWIEDSCCGFLSGPVCSFNPCLFGRRMDPNGIYIGTYLPVLKNFPPEYIHAPWTAPLEVQEAANCIVGVDYPKPIVDIHEQERICQEKLKEMMLNFARAAVSNAH